MKKVLVIIAKLLGFAILAVWILGLLAVGLVLYDPYMKAVEYYFGISSGGLYTFTVAWYWLTLVIVGALVALRAFRLVGKWEKPGKKGDHTVIQVEESKE